MRTLIKNGTLVTAAEQYRADLLIDGETISAIGSGLAGRADTVLDARGRYVFPGGVDGHSHFRLPFMGTRGAGFDTTAAAAVGGTTLVIDFAPQPKGMSLMDSVAKHREEEAEGRSAVDFAFHAIVMDANDSIYAELPALVEAGIPTIKLFMAYKGTAYYADDATLFRTLQKAKDVGMLALVHGENGDLVDVLQKQLIADGKTDPKYHATSRPPIVEAEATGRATMVAQVAGAPLLIVHVSSAEAMLAIRDANERGAVAFGETCPHYLCLSVDDLARPNFEGAKYVLSPPLREAWHQERLWEALGRGWLHVVGSDHCGFNFKGQKEMGRGDFTKIPNGAPGLEHRLTILYTYGVAKGKLSLQRMVDVFSTAPAKLYGAYPQKGSLAVGADADLVVFNPDYRGTISASTSLHGLDYTPYEGFEQIGRAEQVFLRGKLIVDGGTYVGTNTDGKFITRQPFGLAYADRARR